jgi:uncharacterized membrane protein YfcA
MTLSHFWFSHHFYFQLLVLITAIVAGTLGALLGLGGGVLLIPVLTLSFGVPIRFAIGASIVSVIATSSGASASYVRDHLTNVRLAIFLEVATTTGALCGAVLSSYLNSDVLFLIFSAVLLQSAWFMLRKPEGQALVQIPPGSIASRLGLHSSYPDIKSGGRVEYWVHRAGLGFVLMYLAGLISGLLGIGSGALKVLAMDTGMGLPIKVSSATSNFMIGVTAAASAGTYYMKGDVLPELAAPVALGVLAGSWIGAKWMSHFPAHYIRLLFVAVLVIIAIQMAGRGLGGTWNS